MSTPIVFNGVNYTVPAFGDTGYAQGPGNMSAYWIALASGTVQNTGGSFPLTAQLNFGPNFGVTAVNFTSTTTNPATAGSIRLAKTDTIDWRNNANSANLPLGINGSDQLTFSGIVISTAASTVTSVSGTANQITSTGGTTPVLALANPLITPGSVTITGNLTFSPTTAGIVGTTTNNDTATGNVGEYIEASNAGVVFGGNAVYTDITSISLTAGDWDVTGISQLNRQAATITSTVFIGGVSSTAGNSSAGLVTGISAAQQSLGAGDVTFNSISVTLPRVRFSLAGTTTVYLKGFVDNVTAGTPTFSGGLTARRIR